VENWRSCLRDLEEHLGGQYLGATDTVEIGGSGNFDQPAQGVVCGARGRVQVTVTGTDGGDEEYEEK